MENPGHRFTYMINVTTQFILVILVLDKMIR